MHDIELVLMVLLGAVALFAAVSTAIGVPYPIVLVLGGLVLGVVPGLPDVQLEPELVLVIFLPPLLYYGSYIANLRDLRADLRTISLLAVGLVIATAAAVAVAAHAIIDGLPWAAAFALGAIVAPTDPVAATAVLRRLHAPRRTVNVLEGESLINDGTSLVLYRSAIAAVGGSFSLLHASLDFVLDVAGGVAFGLVAGKLIAEFRRRIDDPPIEVTISLLSGYAAYVPAERAGVSGVIAAVTVGVYVGWQAPRISSATMRLQANATWQILTFLLNAFLFVLIGLQLPTVLDGIAEEDISTVLRAAGVVCLVVIATRMIWVHAVTWVIRAIDRRESQRARRGNWRDRTVAGWAGMRGAVSLAAALALEPGFPARNEILFITFAVILATLVLQGLTLPAVIRWAGSADDGEAREDLLARRRATAAALERLDELALEEWTRDDTIERMRALYQYRERRLEARAGTNEDGDDYERRSLKYQKIVRAVIAAQRDAVVQLRNAGEISNDVMHRIERELDLEDERLEI